MYMNGSGMFMMAWMSLLMLVLIAAVIAAVIWLVRTGTNPARHTPGEHPSEAETLLRHRYAAGEIDDEDYQRRLATLRGQHPNPEGRAQT